MDAQTESVVRKLDPDQFVYPYQRRTVAWYVYDNLPIPERFVENLSHNWNADSMIGHANAIVDVIHKRSG